MAVNKVQLGDGTTIIDLTGDTISAGDALVGVSLHLATGEAVTGTLSDFTGADGQNPGTHGLVPAPAAGDQNKVLKGDGTWGAIPKATDSAIGGVIASQSQGFSTDSLGYLRADRANASRDGFMTSSHYNKLYMLPTAAELAASYQAKLVSGTNIKTVQGASLLGSGDISIPDMTGATSSTDGAGGLVPTPEAGDQDKVLRGNGTWSALLDLVYPVGALYLSTSSTSPATLFGGTWTRIQDTFLLAAGTTYAAGATGGEATHTLTESEMPSHTHTVDSASGNPTAYIANQAGSIGGSGKNIISKPILPTGGGQAHNNMPPYYAVYMWERTA